MSKIDILKIISKNAAKSIADSVTTDLVLSQGTFAVGNIASGILNSFGEIKDYSKQAIDSLYYFQIKTFLETADLDQEEINEFLNNNPNNMRLGLEIFKILEKTVLERQAIYLARAFRLYVKEKIKEPKLYEYFHIIQQLDRHTIYEIENDLELYKVHQSNGLWGLPENHNQASIAQFIILSVPKGYLFQKIGFVVSKPKKLESNYSGTLEPEISYERSMLYVDFYFDLIKSD